MSTLSLASAFAAGLISFASPCVLPLVPSYMAYLGANRSKPMVNALCFVLGFGLVFFLLSTPLILGSSLIANKALLSRLGGVLMVVFGLYTLGLDKRLYVHVPYQGNSSQPWGAAVFGAVLAINWTPCIGAILGGILSLNFQSNSLGIGLLLAYIAGLAVPFLGIAAFTQHTKPILEQFKRYSQHGRALAGGIMVAMGLAMVTGQFERLNVWLIKLAPEWLTRWL